MTPQELADLKETLTGQTVMVEAFRPELTRWANVQGHVITINCNGRAWCSSKAPIKAFTISIRSTSRIVEPPAEQPAETEEKKQ